MSPSTPVSLRISKIAACLLLMFALMTCAVTAAHASTVQGAVGYGNNGSQGEYRYEVYQYGTGVVYSGTVRNSGFVSGTYSVSVPSGYSYAAKIIAPDGRVSFTASVYAYWWWGTYSLPSVQF